MGKRLPEGRFHLPRDCAETDRQTSIKNRQRAELRRLQSSVHPQYFVPMFSVRRKVLPTDEMRVFAKNLENHLPRNYHVFNPASLAMTILSQRKIIKQLREADIMPSEDLVQRAAERTAKELKPSLHAVPRRLVIPTGRIDTFGDEGKRDKVGIIPRGWKGFNARYAERGNDAERQILPMPVIIRETGICIGNVVTTFDTDEELSRSTRLAGLSTTPHVTIAQKQRGGPISHSEMQGISAIIEEYMPDSLTLFDPEVRIKLASDEHAQVIHPRSPRWGRNAEMFADPI